MDRAGDSTLVSHPRQAVVQSARLDIRTGVDDALPADGHRHLARLQRSVILHAHDRAGLSFLFQLALNLAWSWIFFRKHALGAAAIEVAVLWFTIGATTVAFGQVSAIAAWLMAPYWAWVTFASILNATIWRLNPTAG